MSGDLPKLLVPSEIMPDSAQKVLHELTAAGLLSADRATDFDAELKTGADALLTRLVADGHITKYQAEKFLNGQASDIYFGDYVVLDKLGQGGMGTVLLAKHRRMDRQVAIKILPVTTLDSKAAVARFYQEVKVAAQLTHPNIVHAYDAGEHHGFQYLVMEYVSGHDLARVLSELGPIPPMLALDYVTQAAAGLEYAHRKGVVHRDIKPSNLLLDDEGTIKVLDMGLARIGGGAFDDEASAALTTTGQMMGTVEYMSPEQAEDTRVADARSDIYSLGCTLYRLITGNGPFTRDTVVKTILAHRDAPIPSIAMGFPEDPVIDNLFRKMIAKDPGDRFQSTTMLLGALRAIADGEPMFEMPPTAQSLMPPANPVPVEPNPGMAVAYRISEADSMDGSIPEAIIPDEAPSRATVPGAAGSTSTPGQFPPSQFPHNQIPASQSSGQLPVAPFADPQRAHSSSEVIYIKDDSLFQKGRGLFSSFRRWFKENPSEGILVRGVFAVVTIPWLAIILGPLTWRYARKKLRMIKKGELNPEGKWMIRVGKYLSIFATIVTIITWIQIIASGN